MKYLFILIVTSFSHLVFADFRFTYNNHTYDVITNPKTWEAASSEAGLNSINGNVGYLVHINDELENQKISTELDKNLPKKIIERTYTFDAGFDIPAVWIGANDIDSEGSWKWVGNNVQFWEGDTNGNSVNSEYNNWGNVEGGAPFNYTGDEANGQDAATIRLTDWVFGKKNQWDDVSVNNSLFYIVEYDAVASSYQNGILSLPSVFVADANGCFDNYTAKLGLGSVPNSLKFSLIEAELLSVSSNCNVNESIHASYQNGILKLPKVSVSVSSSSSVPYEAKLSLVPFSKPLTFELFQAQQLDVLPSMEKEIFADFSITSNCNPADRLPCTVVVEDQSTGTIPIPGLFWIFSDTPGTVAGGESLSHDFSTPGVYQITHLIEADEGSISDKISKEVVISVTSPSDPTPLLNDHPEQVLMENPGFSLTGLSSAIWDHNNISVCWTSTPSAESTFRTWTQNAVEASWERYSAIDFTGWGLCGGGVRPADIVIRVEDIKDSGPSVNGGLGQNMTDMDLNFTFQKWNEYCNPTSSGAATPSTLAVQKLCIESIAVHEFGHALGIAHEQNRDDTPVSCTDPAQGTDGNINAGKWDIDSVMNYCNPTYNNNGILSQGDIAGIQKFYPLVELPTVEIYRIPKSCLPGFGGIGGFFYTCKSLGDDLYRVERYRRTSSDEVDFSSKRVKIVWGENQCATQYWYTSTDLPKELIADDKAYYEINQCEDNVSYRYIKNRQVGSDKSRTIKTESQFTEGAVRPFTRYDEEIRNKNGDTETINTAYSYQYTGAGVDNTVEKPVWVVHLSQPSNNNLLRKDTLYPIAQDTSSINSSFPDTTVGYSYQCIFNNGIPGLYNDSIRTGNLNSYNTCVDNVKERFFTVFKPIPHDLPVW